MRFGLDGEEPKTLKEIGERLNLTRERVRQIESEALSKLYESMNMRRARHYDYIEKARIFLEEAVRRRAAYHIWFHPSDPTEVFEREFYGIVQHMAKLQREGRLWVATMAELAAYCEAREQTTLNVQRNGDELNVALRCNYDVKRYGKTVLTLRVTSDSMPSECMLRTEGRLVAVKWKSEELHVSSKKPRFLVDVPVTANELRVLFRPNYDWKHRRTTTLADPAFS